MTSKEIISEKTIFIRYTKQEAEQDAIDLPPGTVEIVQFRIRRGFADIAERPIGYLAWPTDQRCPVCEYMDGGNDE